MANQNKDGPEACPVEARSPASRRAASKGLVCQRCSKPLTGKKDRWCSDACRMADLRDSDRRRLLERLDTVSAAVEQLRREVLR